MRQDTFGEYDLSKPMWRGSTIMKDMLENQGTLDDSLEAELCGVECGPGTLRGDTDFDTV